MDIGKSFTFPLDDENWIKKLVIGAVLLIIPIVNFIAIGYAIRTLRNVAEGRDKPLPEWDQWGDDFMKGLMVFLAGLIYALPSILAGIIVGIVTAVGGSSNSEGAQGFVALCGTVLSCLQWLWSLVVAVFMPAAIVKYTMEGEFNSFFKFTEIFQWIKDNLKNYVMALLVIIVARIVASFGIIACGIGILFTMFWATLTMSHILGQLVAQINPPAAPATGYGDYTPPSSPLTGAGDSV